MYIRKKQNEEKGNMKQFSYNVVRELDFWCIDRFPGAWL